MTKRQKQKKVKKGFSRKLMYGVLLSTIILLVALVVYYMYFMSPQQNWTATIIDQVAIEEGLYNQDFNTKSTSILNTSGFEVKHYPAEDITVDFYKNLPQKVGKITLLRVHSSVRNETDFVDLFTSELYSRPKETQYSAQYGIQLSIAEFFVFPYNKYFAIGPTFVDLSMRGRFDSDCVVVLMGCNSLEKESMAEALVKKGVKVVIGWTRLVGLNDTDTSTIKLLQYLLREDPYTIKGAVDKVNDESDYTLETMLDYYPKNDETKKFKVPKRNGETSSSLINGLFQVLILATLVKSKSSRLLGFSNSSERLVYSLT